MADVAFLQQLEAKRAQAAGLRTRLGPRRKQEAETLSKLSHALERTDREATEATASEASLRATLPALTEQTRKAEAGVSEATSFYWRFVEPLFLSVGLFVGLVAWGLMDMHHQSMQWVAVAIFGGALLGLLRKRLYGR